MSNYAKFFHSVGAKYLEKATNAQSFELLGCPSEVGQFFRASRPECVHPDVLEKICSGKWYALPLILDHVPGIGIKVGAGSKVQTLLSCSHYHDGKGISERTRLEVDLKPSATVSDIKNVDVMMTSDYEHSLPFGENVVVTRKDIALDNSISLVGLSVHSHSHGRQQVRAEVWIEQKDADVSPTQSLIANVSQKGVLEPDPVVLSSPISVDQSASLIMKCFFSEMSEKNLLTHATGNGTANCDAQLLYFVN